jgi:zinc protease
MRPPSNHGRLRGDPAPGLYPIVRIGRFLRFPLGALVIAVGGCASAPSGKASGPGAKAKPRPAASAAISSAPDDLGQPTKDSEPRLELRITPDAEFRTRPPLPGPERPFSMPPARHFRLKNGLPVVLVESRRLPLVGLELVVRSGNAANPPGLSGLASLVARQIGAGTSTRDAAQIADELAQIGASFGARADWDASSVSLSVLREQLDPALALWAEVLLAPAFDEQELARTRDGLLASLVRRRDDPVRIAETVFARVLFGEEHPYGWPADGTEGSLKRIEAADLRSFHGTYFRPNNAVLIVAGDVSEPELRGKLEPLLGAWRASPVPPVRRPGPPPGGQTTIYLVNTPGAARSAVRIGLPGITRNSPDLHRALVMNHLLGGAFKRFDVSLREQKGWAYSVRSAFDTRSGVGPWVTRAEVVGNRAPDTVAEILRILKVLREREVTEQELRETQGEIIRAFPARLATVSQMAGQLADLAAYGLPASELAAFTRKIAAVSTADLRRTAQKYLLPDRLTVVVTGDRRTLEPALRRIAPVEIRDTEGNPIAVPVAYHSQFPN